MAEIKKSTLGSFFFFVNPLDLSGAGAVPLLTPRYVNSYSRPAQYVD